MNPLNPPVAIINVSDWRVAGFLLGWKMQPNDGGRWIAIQTRNGPFLWPIIPDGVNTRKAVNGGWIEV